MQDLTPFRPFRPVGGYGNVYVTIPPLTGIRVSEYPEKWCQEPLKSKVGRSRITSHGIYRVEGQAFTL